VEAFSQLEEGYRQWQRSGGNKYRARQTLPLINAYHRAGLVVKGLALVEATLVEGEKTNDCLFQAELHRLKGELTLQQNREQGTGNREQTKETALRSLTPDPQAEAEGCFLRAIEIAQRQQAKSLELRAVMSLARLWQRQGKHAEAR